MTIVLNDISFRNFLEAYMGVVAVPLAVDIFVNVSLDSKRLKKG